MKPKFFATPADWREWLTAHHDQMQELLVGFYKKGSGRPSISWPESVDQALCFGWIDGVRRRIDDVSYSIRFTPRKPRSVWSAVNTKRIAELLEQGLVHPAGRKAFEARREERAGIYSFEQADIEWDKLLLARFQANETAWKFFDNQPVSYKRVATWWVISAKREPTRETRLNKLMEASARGERMTW